MNNIKVGAVYRNGRGFFRMKKGPKRHYITNDSFYTWVLWQPVRPVFGGLFYLPRFDRKPFWLDTDGFERV